VLAKGLVAVEPDVILGQATPACCRRMLDGCGGSNDDTRNGGKSVQSFC
jgi:hypothetical protein